MPGEGYQAPAGYLTMAGAMRRLGVSKATLFRIVQRGELETYQDPRNRRVRLVKLEDVERLTRPVPEGKEAA
jgi:excisionase family DNA binding protein